MKSRTFMKTVSCVGILLYLSGVAQCQSRAGTFTRTGTRTAGTRMLGGGLMSPALRLRNMGTLPTSQLSNQTSTRRGTPRLLGFIVPSASGGQPQLRLMPGVRTNSGLVRGRGATAARTLTGVPSNLLAQARSGVRGATRGGQIRRLPQSALNTISAAARRRAPTRQPNIVFVRPPTRNRASGLSPEMVRRIRLAALQRAAGQGGVTAGQRGAIAGQRGATAGQRGATAGQRVATPFSGGFNRNAIIPATGFSRNAILPQTLNRAPVQTGVRLPQTLNRAPVQTGAQRTGAQTRLIPDATIRRRIAAMNAARVKGTSAPRQVRPLPRSTIRTEVLRPSPRSPARVDEAVLRANIVPAGLSPSSNGMRRVVSSSSSSSNESTTSSTTSSDSRVISSGSSTGSVGGLIQTGLTGVQPVGTVIAPTPELQFRTTVGGTPGTAVVAPGGVSGNGAAAPILESGPAFQVVSGDASNVILGPGASLAESMSLDIGSAAGPALVVNPTVVSPGKGVVAATPVGEVSIVQRGATLPVEDPAIFAAAGPTVSGILPVASDASLVGASNIQVAGAVPTLGSAEIAGVGSIVPGSGNVPTTLAKSNPDMNSLKSVITDVLRDMAAHRKSSNVQPDITAMARAVLDAQQTTGEHILPESHQKTPDTNARKPVVQTFTLTPTNPSVIVNADPTDMSLPSKASSQHNQPSHHNHFFSDAGLGTDLLHTAKPAITANPAVNHVSSAIPGVTHPHMMDSFHTHGPHDLAHGPVHSHSNQVSQDNLHHPPHTHDLQHADIGFTKSISQTKIPTMKKQATTAAPVPKKAASDQMNLIVGDWSGAEQSLTGPPPHPPPKRDLALEHPHGHHHFDSHVHGFRAPSIPPPPPLSQMAPSILPVNKHPVSQRIDIHPANQPVDSQNIDIHPAIQPADIHPADQPVDMHPVSQRIDIHSASQPVDIHPANQPVDSQKIDIHPGSQPVDIHSANQLVDSQKIDIHPGSQPVDIHPANQPVDPASQRIDIHSASQSVDIHPASQPVNIHTASQPDNIHPTNASVKQSSATEHIALSPVATGNNNAGITDLTAVNTNLPDPNTGHSVHDPLHSINEHAHSAHDLGHSVHGLGHSVHDLGLSFNDPGHSVHDPGLSGHDPGHNLGPDFSANNIQTGGVSIPVPAASAGIDNINTIAIENKLFDANMALETNAVIPGNVVAERPTLDTTKPIGEQLMKQLPVPTELVTALTGGTADTNIPLGQPAQTDVIPKLSDSMILQGKFPDTISQPRGSISAGGADQGLSLNNVRDGLILDTITSGLQTDTTVNNGLGAMDTMPISSNPLSAPSLDKLAMNMPNDILSVDPTAQSNINNDPTIRKIANILPRTGAMSELPLMSLDAEGFTAEGRFNTFQRGFNRTRKLSSKNGINVQVQLTPHLSTETKSTTSQKTKQDTRTANIQTDGSFLGSRLPVPPKRAGKGVVLSDLSNQQPFYDQSSLLGAFVDVLPKPVTPQIVPVDVPLPPPQTDILMVPSDTASTAPNTAPPTDVQVDTVQVLDIPPPPTVTFTSTFDAPSTQFDNPNVAPPAVPAGGVTTEFVSLENNPNWAVFDPTAISSDMNFADINPLVNGVIASGPEIAFVNTNDIKFTNAFDVAPVAYDQVSGPESPASSSAMTNSIPETSQLNASPDALNTNSNWQINTGSANTEVLVNSVADKIPNDKGLQFQEVVIAPLPAQSTNDLQVSADLPPPPPIF